MLTVKTLSQRIGRTDPRLLNQGDISGFSPPYLKESSIIHLAPLDDSSAAIADETSILSKK